jgi:hypothetical protein
MKIHFSINLLPSLVFDTINFGAKIVAISAEIIDFIKLAKEK